MPIRCGLDQRDLTSLGEHDQMVAGEQQLAVTVAAALPLELTGFGVETREDGFIQAIDETVMEPPSC